MKRPASRDSGPRGKEPSGLWCAVGDANAKGSAWSTVEEFDGAAMGCDEFLGDGKSQAGTTAPLRGLESLE